MPSGRVPAHHRVAGRHLVDRLDAPVRHEHRGVPGEAVGADEKPVPFFCRRRAQHDKRVQVLHDDVILDLFPAALGEVLNAVQGGDRLRAGDVIPVAEQVDPRLTATADSEADLLVAFARRRVPEVSGATQLLRIR
jgi:hypothetical protein